MNNSTEKWMSLSDALRDIPKTLEEFEKRLPILPDDYSMWVKKRAEQPDRMVTLEVRFVPKAKKKQKE